MYNFPRYTLLYINREEFSQSRNINGRVKLTSYCYGDQHILKIFVGNIFSLSITFVDKLLVNILGVRFVLVSSAGFPLFFIDDVDIN